MCEMYLQGKNNSMNGKRMTEFKMIGRVWEFYLQLSITRIGRKFGREPQTEGQEKEEKKEA